MSSTTMGQYDDPGMTHQSKKKRTEDEQPPPDAGQKPIQLQRRRVWRACESCRRKKIKCDGIEPTCSQCAASKTQCTWLQTKDRAALSRHYVQELEARLLHMESLFTQIAPALDQIAPNAGPSTSQPGPPANQEAIRTAASLVKTFTSGGIGHEPSSPSSALPPAVPASPVKLEDDEVESSGQLALDEHGHMRWIGRSSTMSLIQSFRALTTSPMHRISPMEEDPRAPGPSVNKLYFPASVFFGKVSALPGPEEVEYPERDLADKLVDAYFSRFHFLMPVIDKPSFLLQYHALMDNQHDVSLARSETPFLSMVFAVFACAARLVDDPRLLTSSENPDDGGMGMVYYERALILHYISHASIQVAHVQCLTLMASFLCSVNCLPQAWLLTGQALRSAQDLGLHRSPRRLNISAIDQETRRKIWWGVYALDRMLALALGRPLGIEDSDCDVEWPVEYDDDELPDYYAGVNMSKSYPSLMAGSVALFRLYQIAGRILRDVYNLELCKDELSAEKKADLQRTVEALDQELTKWCDDLPVTFKSEPINEKQVSMGAVLCSHYYSVLTTLHRNFLPVKKDQPAVPKSTAKAVSSARSCIKLASSIRAVVPPSHHLAFFIQHLFSSAVIILLYSMHATDPRAASAAMEEARSCLNALDSWVGYWPGAYKCKELLTELANTANEAIQKAQSQQAGQPLERRRSIGMGSPTSPSGSRMIKNKPSRNRSRDPLPTRRPPVVNANLRLENQRARSTSRKRPHAETDSGENGNAATAYHSLYNSPHSNPSTHSSPASANAPSPLSGPPDSALDMSPRMQPSTSATLTYAQPHVSPQAYDFDFNAIASSSTNQWNNAAALQPGIPNDMNMFSSAGFQPTPLTMAGNTYGLTNPMNTEPNYMNYDMSSGLFGDMNTTTPPTATFDAPGLPFRGLDFIRNYDQESYSPTGIGQDSLWQSFDPGAFGDDPELPFTALGDIPEAHEGRS